MKILFLLLGIAVPLTLSLVGAYVGIKASNSTLFSWWVGVFTVLIVQICTFILYELLWD